MQKTISNWAVYASLALAGTSVLAACGKTEPTAPATSASATTTDQGTVPPPPGDSTPKAADSQTRAAASANEKTGTSQPQSTVGTAAAGAPPYTLNGAPEGNPAPSQGTKAAEPAKP